MLAGFGVVTLTGNAQPVLGDVTTAAVAIPPDGIDAIVTVATTAPYNVGWRITIDPRQTNQDSYKITKILSSTTMQCSLEGSVGHAHASGAIIQLAIACSDMVVQALNGGAGAVVIGLDNTVTAVPGGLCVYEIQKSTAPAQPNQWKMANSSDGDNFNTAAAWMIGTAGDKVLPYALVI